MNVSGAILKWLLKEQNTKASSGSPSSLRVNARSAERTLEIVGLKTVGEADDLLAVIEDCCSLGMTVRSAMIVDIVCARGPRKAEIVHLQRCGPHGKDGGPGAFGVSHQIDGNIDLVLTQQARYLKVGLAANINEAVECGFGALARCAAVIATERDRYGFKTGPVVLFENAGHKLQHGMGAEIGRNIGEADAIVSVAFRGAQRACGSPHFMHYPKGVHSAIDPLPMRKPRSARPAGSLAAPPRDLVGTAWRSCGKSAQSH